MTLFLCLELPECNPELPFLPECSFSPTLSRELRWQGCASLSLAAFQPLRPWEACLESFRFPPCWPCFRIPMGKDPSSPSVLSSPVPCKDSSLGLGIYCIFMMWCQRPGEARRHIASCEGRFVFHLSSLAAPGGRCTPHPGTEAVFLPSSPVAGVFTSLLLLTKFPEIWGFGGSRETCAQLPFVASPRFC